MKLNFKPMLAKQYIDYKHKIDWSQGVLVSPKLDGLRCIATKDGTFSRNGNALVSFPHISKALEPLFTWASDLILDGEIYTSKLSKDFNKIISLARKTKPSAGDIAESAKFLEYWAFDIPSIKSWYEHRYEAILHLRLASPIVVCPHIVLYSNDTVMAHAQEYIANGYEGAMVNIPSAEYVNRRTNALLKYKVTTSERFEILDITEGIGKRSGMFGRALMRNNTNDETFEASSTGDDNRYTDMLNFRDTLIGRFATVKFRTVPPSGKFLDFQL